MYKHRGSQFIVFIWTESIVQVLANSIRWSFVYTSPWLGARCLPLFCIVVMLLLKYSVCHFLLSLFYYRYNYDNRYSSIGVWYSLQSLLYYRYLYAIRYSSIAFGTCYHSYIIIVITMIIVTLVLGFGMCYHPYIIIVITMIIITLVLGLVLVVISTLLSW